MRQSPEDPGVWAATQDSPHILRLPCKLMLLLRFVDEGCKQTHFVGVAPGMGSIGPHKNW